MSLRLKKAFLLWYLFALEEAKAFNEALAREVAELREAKAAALADEEAARASRAATRAQLEESKALLDQLRRRAADRDAQAALASARRGDEAVRRAIDQAKMRA